MTTYNKSYQDTFPFSDTTAQFGLSSAMALSYTVPGTKNITYRAQFSFPESANVWVGYNVTATLPTENTMTSNSNIELNPGKYDGYGRYIRGGDVLSFISTLAITDVGISLLKIPTQGA